MNTNNYIPKLKIMLLSIVIGLLTGLVSLVFNIILDDGFTFVGSIYQNKVFIFIIPMLAALFVAFIRHKLLDEHNQGFGVSQVMYEIELIKTQVMKPSAVFYKILGTFVTLIAGFAVGRQGPVVHLGGAIGSKVAYHTKLQEDETRVLIGCGVAGCLAGIFNSPIFATLFVVEIMFKKRYFDMISTIMASALASTIIVRVIGTDSYFINFQTDYLFHMTEMVNFIVLGLVIGLLAILYMVSLRKAKDFFSRLTIKQYQKNIIGALTISMMLYFSNVYFYNPAPNMLAELTLSSVQLYIIALVLMVLTAISIASGAFGGIFTPGLIIGMTFGLGLSKSFVNLGLPLVDNSTYAMAGMAAMFAGFASAPLSAGIMIVELTGQYNLIFPMMISTLIASKVTEFIYHDSIYHKNLNDLLKA